VQGLTGWGTPGAEDWKGSASTRESDARSQLKHQVVAGLATPRAEDSEQTGAHRGTADTLTRLGPTSASSTAETAKPVAYRLNPKFSLWLQGFPIEWARCAEQVTRLSRKSRPSL
jgi:hypothetical protein